MDDVNVLKARISELEKEIEILKNSASRSLAIEKKEDEYNESQVRFRTVFERSRLGNKIISSDLTILQVNPAMVNMLGYENKDEIVGTKIMEFTPPECQKEWKNLQTNLWENASESFSLETCLKKKDGTLLNCQVTSILFQDQGETLGYTIIEDITEQKRLRQHKEDFISVASHELKTPVATLRAALQLINRMLLSGNGVTDKVKSLAESAELNVIKLGNLVTNLLDSTKIEHGQLSLNKTKFKISKLVEECCQHIHQDANYYIKLTGDPSIEVCADKEKIEQVLVNLANNAVKYAPESNEIVINTVRSGEFVKVSISDKGPGISESNISRIFDRHFRVDTNGAHSSGLGLGLYISSEIIKRHGGEMYAESDFGNGSTFWFTIPDEIKADDRA